MDRLHPRLRRWLNVAYDVLHDVLLGLGLLALTYLTLGAMIYASLHH
jgi:hypothetical protein